MLTIPDYALAAVNGHPQQAAPDTTDIAALVAGISGQAGVQVGFDVTFHGTMTLSIANGSAFVNGSAVSFVGGDITIGSNTSGYQRADMICLKSDGTLDLIQGVPGNPPIPPGLPATECYLYRVDVSNGISQIMSSDVTDKRAPLAVSGSSGGGAPTGAAGGDLTGSAYPNPVIANGVITSAKISDGTIVDADISGSAAIGQAKVSGLTSSLSGKQDTSAKGVANGYAGLDASGLVPLSQLPNIPQSQVTGLVSALASTALDSTVVHISGAETVAGVKTFSARPVFQSGIDLGGQKASNAADPTAGTDLVTLQYANAHYSGAGGGSTYDPTNALWAATF